MDARCPQHGRNRHHPTGLRRRKSRFWANGVSVPTPPLANPKTRCRPAAIADALPRRLLSTLRGDRFAAFLRASPSLARSGTEKGMRPRRMASTGEGRAGLDEHSCSGQTMVVGSSTRVLLVATNPQILGPSGAKPAPVADESEKSRQGDRAGSNHHAQHCGDGGSTPVPLIKDEHRQRVVLSR